MHLKFTTLLLLLHQLYPALSIANNVSSVPLLTTHLSTNTGLYDEKGKFDTIYSFTLQADKAHSCTITYSYTVTLKQPIVIRVESEQANFDYPVLFGIRQQLGIISWQIPLDLDPLHQYRTATRILCPIWNYGIQNVSLNQHVVLYVSSDSKIPLNVTALLTRKKDFFLRLNEPHSFIATPSHPMYFEATLPKDVENVKLIVTSDSNICAIVSIQPIGCPVYDVERNIKFVGSHLTMTTQAALNLKASDYTDRKFYVVVVVKHHDEACNGEGDDVVIPNGYFRGKNFTVKMETAIKGSVVLKGIFLVPCIAIGICIIIIFIHVKTNETYWAYLRNLQRPLHIPISTINPVQHTEVHHTASGRSLRQARATQEDDEVDHLCVPLSALSKLDSNYTDFRIKGYFFITLSVVILYFLPVSKLVYNYEKLKKSSGDLDVCYYNSLCMYTYGKISDLNHLLSNILYVILGIVYILIILIRHKQRSSSSSAEEGVKEIKKPVPWIYFGMGVALIGEGIMSACYHICPNKSNFLFDTAFMYLIAAICMVKTYHSRRPDISASAYSFFLLYSLLLIFGLLGEIWHSVIFWTIYFILHVLGCFLLTARIYVKKPLTLNRTLAKKVLTTIKNDWQSKSRPLNPPHLAIDAADGSGAAAEGEIPDQSCCSKCDPNLVLTRMFLLGMIFFLNFALAVYGIANRPTGFATHLLTIFIGNLIFYITYYVVMKIRSGEFLCPPKDILVRFSFYYSILSLICWVPAMYFFYVTPVTQWEKTAAQSRALNRPCLFMDFYDAHDVWHFLSAGGLFFSFLMLVTMDDDIIYLPQEQVMVF